MEKRNTLSISDITQFIYRMPGAVWKDWTINNAVKDGYKASGWVYRAISIIARNAAEAPLVVYNGDNEIEWEHPLTKLLAKPNPRFTNNLMTQLMMSWLNLSGETYFYKNIVRNQTAELWPISPDRIDVKPISSDGLKVAYEEIVPQGAKKSNLELNEQTIIPVILPDPANPLRGIGPLQVAARAVDTDNEQSNWNKSAMQNRAVLDGFFSFDKDFTDQNMFELYLNKLKERFSGQSHAREPGLIGSNAKYQQLSLSPVEMDFLNSRKFNREEIFIIFGVPPQLAGVTDAMTYNVYESSLRILWESTLLPLMKMECDALNAGFVEELPNGEYIGHDTSNVKALKEAEKEKAETAQLYYNMGVPMKQLNEKFELGLTEYDGWDVSRTATNAQTQDPNIRAELLNVFLDWEKRAVGKNVKKQIAIRDKLAETVVKDKFEELLAAQEKAVLTAVENGTDIDVALSELREEWDKEFETLFTYVASKFNDTLVVDKRG